MSRFIRKLHLKNLLSFDDCEVELRDLNVLIGPNGAGKSNLIESIGLLRSLVYDHSAYMQQGGGTAAWIWKGQPAESCQIDSTLGTGNARDLLHSFVLDSGLRRERLALLNPETPVFDMEDNRLSIMGTALSQYTHGQSMFRQYKNPADPTPISETGRKLGSIRIYREFRTTRFESLRLGYAGSDAATLDEGGQNLGLILHELDIKGKLDEVIAAVAQLSGDYGRVKPRFIGGNWFVQLEETGLLDPIPSQRISDGTLKFLCLAAVLLDPQPPPLICIEEPETGLHPDALRAVARLLREASERTQLVVTTHSADLINEFGATPEAVLVAGKNSDNSTRFERLDRDKLQLWLERYKLGELWRKGEIGGNRW